MRAAAAMALLVSLLALPPMAGATECLKQVFHQYCLGASESTLPPLDLPDLNRVESDGAATLFYNPGDDLTLVQVYEGRVMRVTKILSPATHLTLMDYQRRLTDLYGEHINRDVLPDYATTDTMIDLAISNGEGRIVRDWNQDGWTVRVVWKQPGMMLTYWVDSLMADYMAQRRGEGL